MPPPPRPADQALLVFPLRERALFLVSAGLAILLTHLADVLRAGGPDWPAFAVRLAWCVLLLAMALLVRLAARPVIRVGAVVAALGSAVLYLLLVDVTGGRRSPVLPFSHVLVLVIPIVMPELPRAALAASAAVLAGVWWQLLGHGASAGEVVGWAQVGLVALAIGTTLALALARSRRAEAAARAAREEAQARLAESERRRERDERLAAVGLLAAEVAHQINNPLSAARATATYLRDAAGGQDAEAVEAGRDLVESLDRIALAVRRLQRDAVRPEDPAPLDAPRGPPRPAPPDASV